MASNKNVKSKSIAKIVTNSALKPAASGLLGKPSNRNVRIRSPTTGVLRPVESIDHLSQTSSDLANNMVNPDLLSTVTLKKKKGPISRRTKLARNQAEQEMLAKQKTYQTINYLHRKTRFNMEEVKALIEIYRKIRGMGKMDRLRFRETMHSNFGLTDDVMLDRVFGAFDGDSEGSVSESEWVIGLSVMIRGDLEEQIAYCYEVYDVNGDRSIGRDELYTCLRGCLYPIPGHENDTENDLEEGTREIVELAMRKLDLDHDGVIKYADFHQAVKQDPILLQAIGACLPTDRAMLTFVSLFDSQTRNFSTHLSHQNDPGWIRERDKFNPVVQEEIKWRFNIKGTMGNSDLKLRSIFNRKSVNSLKGMRFNRH